MNSKENNSNNSKLISFNDVNYAIYKVGNWKNNYKINLIGTSNEIPATEITKNHVLLSMDEIKKSTFEMKGKSVNGIVGLAIQLNKDLDNEDIDEIIAKEQVEYENILNEINNLELEDPDDSIDLNNEKFLIYELKKDHHVTVANPANEFTKKYHIEEIKKLKETKKNNN